MACHAPTGWPTPNNVHTCFATPFPARLRNRTRVLNLGIFVKFSRYCVMIFVNCFSLGGGGCQDLGECVEDGVAVREISWVECSG